MFMPVTVLPDPPSMETPVSNSVTVPFLTVTPVRPSTRMPGPSPPAGVPEMVKPARSRTTLLAPMVRPSEHGPTLLWRVVLATIVWPHVTWAAAAGPAPITREVAERATADEQIRVRRRTFKAPPFDDCRRSIDLSG